MARTPHVEPPTDMHSVIAKAGAARRKAIKAARDAYSAQTDGPRAEYHAAVTAADQAYADAIRRAAPDA